MPRLEAAGTQEEGSLDARLGLQWAHLGRRHPVTPAEPAVPEGEGDRLPPWGWRHSA